MPSPRFTRRLTISALAVAACVATLPGTAAPAAPTTTQACPIPVIGQDPDTVGLAGATSLWPPNHRFAGYSLTSSETAGEKGNNLPHGVTISYSVTVTENGATSAAKSSQASPPSGQTSGDFSVTIPFQLRAERLGKSSGRTYTINWSASFDGPLGHSCSSTDGTHQPFVVTVPHDQGHK
jgi:hypothetical protein